MRTYLLILSLAAALGLATVHPGAARTQDQEVSVVTTVAADIASDERSAVASTNDYVRREGQARDLESFTGGRHEDFIIVGCSCVALVILVLILL